MKTVYFEKLPECDYKNVAPGCTGDAMYDAPTLSRGKWAHMCEYHYQMFKSPAAEVMGCKLAQRDLVKPKKGEAKMGLEPGEDNLAYWENVMFDSLREIKCPDCGEVRNVEPDTTGVFDCEGCGIPVKCPEPIF